MDAPSPIRLAQDNLSQAERWKPTDEHGRRMKALNVTQILGYLAGLVRAELSVREGR